MTGPDALSESRPALRAERVTRSAGGRLILDGVDLEARAGSTVGLIGPNGSGKSTLLRLLAGLLAPSGGTVTVDGTTPAELGRRETARRLAVVGQHAATDTDLTVRDVVGLGRVPHRRAWAAPGAADREAVRAALERTGLVPFADRLWHTLSGGERQRAQIARALAQEPRHLLLDEPTNHLDVQHQLEVMSLVAGLPVTCVVALHDLNLAAMFCDEVVVLRAGRAVVSGPPGEVLSEGLIAEVYGVRARVVADGGGTFVRFLAPGAGG
ncbi:ABC transporter ATP-binding protein [Streptomyces albidoflavus]|uniref:ABC transporter ATP-binding protein n=1 Tax=Streptomyces albidoflavus TaxID=1886 RepID=UPI00308839FF|nr:ABC transporter ATP-binding protein [Streptomyces albidoflavus]